MPDDPKVIMSELSSTIEGEGTSVAVSIYRLENESEWSLEIFDENWNSTVWDNKFATEQEALDEAIATINAEGIWSLVFEGGEDDEGRTVH
jgi:hypothetical protein